MSTYVMSDIHGCYDELIAMLEKIAFGEKDRLIVAGDYIDRGVKNYEMLKWIESAPSNVVFIRGNHDEEFAYCIDLMEQAFKEIELPCDNLDFTKLVYERINTLTWQQLKYGIFDAYGTIKELIIGHYVTMKQLIIWRDCIRKMPLVHKEKINGRICVCVHAGYTDTLEGKKLDCVYETIDEFYIYARDDAYMYGGIEHGIIVAGHTPTIFEEEITYNDGRVYRSYDEEQDCVFYCIDCGYVFKDNHENANLACLRIEDEEVFYL